MFDKGNYEVSFDAVFRRGTLGANLIVSIDGKQVFTLEAARITKDWNRYTSPKFSSSQAPIRWVSPSVRGRMVTS